MKRNTPFIRHYYCTGNASDYRQKIVNEHLLCHIHINKECYNCGNIVGDSIFTDGYEETYMRPALNVTPNIDSICKDLPKDVRIKTFGYPEYYANGCLSRNYCNYYTEDINKCFEKMI